LNNGTRGRLQPNRILRTSLFVLAVSLWLQGCAGVSVKSAWQDGVPRHQTFSRVLVVGVSANYDLRCAYESAFASQLRGPATTVFSSCDSMSSKEPLTRENLERVIGSVHADAVLATRLVSAESNHGQGSSSDMRGDSRYKAIDVGYGVYGMPVTYAEFQTAPPLTSLTNSIHITTRLYATSTAALLYTLDTKTKAQEIDSTPATLLTITAPTADRLRRDGLIR
jgi:hypothetical protein